MVRPADDILYKIAADNNVPLDWLLYGFQNSPPSEPLDSEKLATCRQSKKNNWLKNIDNKKPELATVASSGSEVTELQRELREQDKELRELLRQNGDLRVENAELRARVRDLERELREALNPSQQKTPMAGAG